MLKTAPAVLLSIVATLLFPMALLAQGMPRNTRDAINIKEQDTQGTLNDWEKNLPGGRNLAGITQVKRVGGGNVVMTFDVGPVATLSLLTPKDTATVNCSPDAGDPAIPFNFTMEVFGVAHPAGAATAAVPPQNLTNGQGGFHAWARPTVMVAGGKTFRRGDPVATKAGEYNQVFLEQGEATKTQYDNDTPGGPGGGRTFIPKKDLPVFDIRRKYPGQFRLVDAGGDGVGDVLIDIPLTANVKQGDVSWPGPVALGEFTSKRLELAFDSYWRTDCNENGAFEGGEFVFRVNWAVHVHATTPLGNTFQTTNGDATLAATAVTIDKSPVDATTFTAAQGNAVGGAGNGHNVGKPGDWKED